MQERKAFLTGANKSNLDRAQQQRSDSGHMLKTNKQASDGYIQYVSGWQSYLTAVQCNMTHLLHQGLHTCFRRLDSKPLSWNVQSILPTSLKQYFNLTPHSVAIFSTSNCVPFQSSSLTSFSQLHLCVAAVFLSFPSPPLLGETRGTEPAHITVIFQNTASNGFSMD